jgi:hypothetical protein
LIPLYLRTAFLYYLTKNYHLDSFNDLKFNWKIKFKPRNNLVFVSVNLNYEFFLYCKYMKNLFFLLIRLLYLFFFRILVWLNYCIFNAKSKFSLIWSYLQVFFNFFRQLIKYWNGLKHASVQVENSILIYDKC